MPAYASGDLRHAFRVRLLPCAAGHAAAVGRADFGARTRTARGAEDPDEGLVARVPATERRAHRLRMVGPDELCAPPDAATRHARRRVVVDAGVRRARR